MPRVCMAALAALIFTGAAAAQFPMPGVGLMAGVRVRTLNHQMAGSLVDYTANGLHDHRIYSAALGTKRDLYVYLPPGYDPAKKYPLMICLHGFNHDERNFLEVAPVMDRAMVCGEMPPMIVAAPDGSIKGRPSLHRAGSFYINSLAGRFEDYIAEDVYDFICKTYPVLPGKEAHILSGVSMGGYGAINLGIKHRAKFGVAVGVMPPLNSRFSDCYGNYFGDFDPNCYKLEEVHRPHKPVARFQGWYGTLTIRRKLLTDPLFGRGPDAIARISMENAIEQIDRYNLKNGELDMFVCYGKQDEFNIDAQVESFLYETNKRGIHVTAYVNPTGKHDIATGTSFLPFISTFIKERVPNVNAKASITAP